MKDQDASQSEEPLSEELLIYPRGHSSIPRYFGQIPGTWQHALTSDDLLEDLIAGIWLPIQERARAFTFRLAMITSELSLVVSPSGACSPQLCYMSNSQANPNGWLAGQPARHEEIEQLHRTSGFALPASYKRFVQIHNGFLENGNGELGFKPLNKLYLRAARPDFDTEAKEAKNLDKHPEQMHLLEFFAHQDGSRQCFDMQALVGHEDYMTVIWDPTSQARYHPQSFWSFLKEFTISTLR